MLKYPAPRFCSYLSIRFRDIAEKQIAAKLKPKPIRCYFHILTVCLIWYYLTTNPCRVPFLENVNFDELIEINVIKCIR